MRALKTVGYVISHKNGENRRALFPAQCTQLKFPGQAIFETGYGLSLGFSDADYERAGVKIASREEVLRADVIVDVKLGDAEYLDALVPWKDPVRLGAHGAEDGLCRKSHPRGAYGHRA